MKNRNVFFCHDEKHTKKWTRNAETGAKEIINKFNSENVCVFVFLSLVDSNKRMPYVRHGHEMTGRSIGYQHTDTST